MILKLQKFFFALFVFCLANLAKGQLGGQITASLISSTKAVVKAELYRDCRAMPLSKSSFTYGFCLSKPSGTATCTTQTLTIPYLKFKDITYVPKGVSLPCKLGGMSSYLGVELEYFTDTVDLSSSGILSLISSTGCTNLTFYINRCCRSLGFDNGASNTDFYIASTIYFSNLNRCKKKTNQAPVLLFYPQTSITDMEKHMFTPAPVDSIENDKITCKMSAPIEGLPNKEVALKAPYTANAPFQTYCDPAGTGFCSPNLSTSPISGFNVDTITGKMMYFSTVYKITSSGTVSNGVMLFNEYREDTTHNWVQIGQGMREFPFVISDVGGQNNPPVILNTSDLSATAGRSFYKEIKVTDDIKTGYQTAADTIQVTAISGCKAFSMYIKNPKDREKIVVISGTPDTTYCSKTPYRMSILANDQYKTFLELTSAQIMLRVKPLGSYVASVKMGNCNRVILDFKAGKEVTGTVNVTWTVKDSATGKIEYTGNGKLASFLDSSITLSKGIKIIKVYPTGSDYGFDVKTYVIDANYEAIFNLSGALTYCKGSTVSFTALPVNMKKIKSVLYVISPSYTFLDTMNKFTSLKVDSAFTLFATAKDVFGCVATNSVNIKLTNLPEKQFIKGVSICQNDGQFDLLALCSLKTNEYIQLSSKDGLVLYGQYFDATLISSAQFVKNTPVLKTIFYKVTDGNNCIRNDSVVAKIYQLPQIKLDSIQLCQNTLSLNLDKQMTMPLASKLSAYRYQWSVISCPSKINSTTILKTNIDTVKRYFKYGNAASEDYQGRYQFKIILIDTETHCVNTDSLSVVIENEPTISFTDIQQYCANKSNIDLFETVRVDGKKVTSGGLNLTAFDHSNMNATFYNTSIVNNHYLPKNAAVGLWEFAYSTLSKCKDTLFSNLRILPTPQAYFTLSTDTIIDVETSDINAINNSYMPDNTLLSYVWNPGTGNVSDKKLTTNFKFSYPKIEANYILSLIANSTTNGCSDTSQIHIVVKKNVSTNSLEAKGGYFNEKLQVSGLPFVVNTVRWYNVAGQWVGVDKNNQGIALPVGLYFYEIEYTYANKNNKLKGKYIVK